MSGKLRWGACSEVGLVRQINEDSMWHEPPLFAVADGMGGHSAGDVASAMAVEKVAKELARADSLSDAVHAANRAIFERASANPELAGMGTTITALYTDESSAQIAHVGDSRAYLLREGDLSRLTTDHTVVGRLVQQGRLMQEDADRHPQRSYLERALGVDSDVEVDVHVLEFQPGDRVLLCSDGLFGMIDDELILRTLEEERDPQRAAERLCEEAVHAGGSDNVTCLIIDFPRGSSSETKASSSAAKPTVLSAAGTDTGPMHDGSAETRSWTAPTLAAAPPRGIGAVAPASPPRTASLNSPSPAETRPSPDGVSPPKRKHPRRKALISLSLAVIALGALVVAVGMWLNGSWYVGQREGRVAIFNGVKGELAGMELSDLEEQTELAVDSLPEIDRVRLEEGIRATSRSDAQNVVRNLEAKVSSSPSPAPEPTPEPSPAQPPPPPA